MRLAALPGNTVVTQKSDHLEVRKLRPAVPVPRPSRPVPMPGPSSGDGSRPTGRPVQGGGQALSVPVVVGRSVGAPDEPVTSHHTGELLRRVADHCAGLVPGGAAGIVVLDDDDHPRLAAASIGPRSVHLFEVAAEQTPGVVAARTGRPVILGELTAGHPDTAAWCRRAHAAGYRSAHAIPMRLHARVVGALTILDTRPGPLPAGDLATARAFADIATITLLAREQADRFAALADQLHLALESRVVIEQAKGVIAGALDLSVEEAFDLLRHNSHHTSIPLARLAHDITTRTISFRDLVWPVHPGWDQEL